MKNLVREPLLHFLLIGAGLFLVYALVDPTDEVESDRQIVISAGRIEQLTGLFEKTRQRPPTDEELKGLVNEFVLEEVYYRQALALGIDRDDTVIRRRLRQKLEFLIEDTADLIEPRDEQLGRYLAENADKFCQSPTYTFRQLYFNPSQHGDDPETYVASQRDLLRAGKTVKAGPGLLPSSFDQASRQEVDGAFGNGFSQKLDGLATGPWQGPIRSGMGLHLVRIEERVEGRLPKLADVRPEVEREWVYEHQMTIRENMNEDLRQKYDIVIEWPKMNATRSPGEGESL